MFKAIAALIAVLLVSACATGSAVVTGTKRPAIAPSAVQLYSKPPAEYDVVGIVEASSDAGLTEQGSMDYAVEELKKQAAAIGANGLLITSVGERRLAPAIVAEAIYVRKQ